MLSLPPILAILAFTASISAAQDPKPGTLIPLYIRSAFPVPKGGGGGGGHGGGGSHGSSDSGGSDSSGSHGSDDGDGSSSSGSGDGSSSSGAGAHPVPPTPRDIYFAPAPQRSICFGPGRCPAVVNGAAVASGNFHFLPNNDTAVDMANLDVSSQWLGVLDAEQQAAFIASPLCFYVNMERLYAGSTATTTTSSATVTTVTTASGALGASGGFGGTASGASGTTALAKRSFIATVTSQDLPSIQSYYFETVVPERLESIYAVATGPATYTTTCTGFDSGDVYTTKYLTSTVSQNAVSGAAARWKVGFEGVVGVMLAAVWLLL